MRGFRPAGFLRLLKALFRPAGRVTSSLRTQRGSAPTPRQEAEYRYCVEGREAGRRARNEGTGTSLRDAPGWAQPEAKIISVIGLGIAALVLAATTSLAHAFDLADLSTQLAKPTVVRGPFVQEKHLRALPTPLASQGQFVLSRDHGLLWLLQKPLKQDYRIDDSGIARRTPEGWQQQPGQGVAAQQSRLFLAVLKGDRSGLERDFDLKLTGEQNAWQLELTPHSLLLKQIFSAIRIDGGARVERIELIEIQGDRTVLKLPQSRAGDALTAQERADLVH